MSKRLTKDALRNGLRHEDSGGVVADVERLSRMLKLAIRTTIQRTIERVRITGAVVAAIEVHTLRIAILDRFNKQTRSI